jgi:hypothetical protein
MSYVKKLLKVLNKWGEFYSEETKSFYKRVPAPKGVIRESINDSSGATGAGAMSLTPQIINKMKLKMPEGQWEYLHVTLWLGLRPTELDAILKSPDKYFQKARQGNVTIIGVYQAKLVNIPKEKLWKWDSTDSR